MPHLEFTALTLMLVQIAVVLVVSRALAQLMRVFRQPSVVAEILTGILLGPSMLGLIWPEGMMALFPSSSLGGLRMLSQLGLLLFMFSIGLELDASVFKGRAHSLVLISHTSIIVPFALGAIAGWWLWPAYSGPDVSRISFVLFLGTAMSVTAFPVLARILAECGLLHSRIGSLVLGCAAVDDVTAWCLLACVVAIARSRELTAGVWTTALAVGFAVAMFGGVKPLLSRYAERIRGQEGLTPAVMASTLLLLLVASSVTDVIGIHALFGAFVLGSIIPRQGGIAQAIKRKIETVAVVLLLPLFFAHSGLRTQIGLVSGPTEWLVTAGLIAIATLGKFGGSAVASRLAGLPWREAGAVGVLMNTRGLMELVVLNIGMDLGVISPVIFTMLVIMALLTTVATSPILAWVYPAGEFAHDPSIDTADAVAHAPAP